MLNIRAYNLPGPDLLSVGSTCGVGTLRKRNKELINKVFLSKLLQQAIRKCTD